MKYPDKIYKVIEYKVIELFLISVKNDHAYYESKEHEAFEIKPSDIGYTIEFTIFHSEHDAYFKLKNMLIVLINQVNQKLNK